MDQLHRRRSVLVRMTAEGDVLERVRIVNDVDGLAYSGWDPLEPSWSGVWG
jgi:hypothetical protein